MNLTKKAVVLEAPQVAIDGGFLCDTAKFMRCFGVAPLSMTCRSYAVPHQRKKKRGFVCYLCRK